MVEYSLSIFACFVRFQTTVGGLNCLLGERWINPKALLKRLCKFTLDRSTIDDPIVVVVSPWHLRLRIHSSVVVAAPNTENTEWSFAGTFLVPCGSSSEYKIALANVWF